MINNLKKIFSIKNIALFGAVFLVLDRVLKLIAINFIGEKKLIGDYLTFTFTGNQGIAFSLPVGGILLYLLLFFAFGFLFWYLIFALRKRQQKTALIIIILILAALSNLFDRMVYGYVIDYFKVFDFSILNLADCLIILSAIALVF